MSTIVEECPAFSDILEFHKPQLIMYEINFTWSVEMAMSRNIPSIHFQIMGATTNVFFLCMFKHWGVQFHSASIFLKDYEMNKLHRVESSSIHGNQNDHLFDCREQSTEIIMTKGFWRNCLLETLTQMNLQRWSNG